MMHQSACDLEWINLYDKDTHIMLSLCILDGIATYLITHS